MAYVRIETHREVPWSITFSDWLHLGQPARSISDWKFNIFPASFVQIFSAENIKHFLSLELHSHTVTLNITWKSHQAFLQFLIMAPITWPQKFFIIPLQAYLLRAFFELNDWTGHSFLWPNKRCCLQFYLNWINNKPSKTVLFFQKSNFIFLWSYRINSFCKIMLNIGT